MSTISLYPVITDVKNSKDLSIDTFLQQVKDGRWQDEIIKLRAEGDETKRKTLKNKLPYVTISGKFKYRNENGLEKHSGFICMDIDHVENINEVKSELCADNYFYSIFTSCSGNGLCAIAKINPKAHLESFNFLSEHLFTKYSINVDEKCKDVSRPRYVTYDPDIYINESSQLCPVKPTAKKKAPAPVNYVFQENDFTEIINQVQAARIDLTTDYEDWIKVGLALANKFGEQGREYFHAFSQYNESYSQVKADKKYTHLLKSTDQKVSIGTIYYLAKQRGLNIYSQRTQNIIRTVRGINRVDNDTPKIERVKRSLREIDGFTEEDIEQAIPLVNQVLSEPVSGGDDNLILDIKIFIKQNYNLKKNLISRNIELEGVPIDDNILNSIFIHVRTYIEKATKDIVFSIIFSDFCYTYDPFIDFIKKMNDNPPTKPRGHILKLIQSISTDTPNVDLFVRKWLVAMIASIHGYHSPLVLVLCGRQNSGKTAWLRQLLPVSLRKYYAESKLDAGKDDEILMTKKLVIMDDEMGGKSKQESKKLKDLTSKETFSIREPYGRVSCDLKRLAILCGTTNDEEILNDPTGNRRLLPVKVLKILWQIYNSIDKDLLFYEVYLEYKEGYAYDLSDSEISLLNESTVNFKQSSTEEELVLKYYGAPDEYEQLDKKEVTNSDILTRIQNYTNIKLSQTRLGLILKTIGFEQKHIKVKGMNSTKRVYVVVEL